MPFMVKFKLLEELWTEPRHFVVEPTVAANLKYDISNGNSPYIHLISTFWIFIFEIRRVDNRLSSITSSNSFFKAHIIQYRFPGAWIAAEQFHQGEIRSSTRARSLACTHILMMFTAARYCARLYAIHSEWRFDSLSHLLRPYVPCKHERTNARQLLRAERVCVDICDTIALSNLISRRNFSLWLHWCAFCAVWVWNCIASVVCSLNRVDPLAIVWTICERNANTF